MAEEKDRIVAETKQPAPTKPSAGEELSESDTKKVVGGNARFDEADALFSKR